MIRQGRLISSTVLAATLLSLTLHGPSEGAGACEAFSQTEVFDDLIQSLEEWRFGETKIWLRSALIGERCSDEEVVRMMQRMGWRIDGIFRRNYVHKSDTLSEYNKIIQFCVPWNFPRSIFGGCAGIGMIYMFDDRITSIESGGNI